MTPKTRDQPVATPAKERRAGRAPEDSGRTTSPRQPAGQHGPTVREGWPILRRFRQASGGPPGRAATEAGRRRDPTQGAGDPERAGSGPSASSQAPASAQDARQPPGGHTSGPERGAGHAPEDRQTSGSGALAERHAREGIDRLAGANSRRSDMAYFWTAISKHLRARHALEDDEDELRRAVHEHRGRHALADRRRAHRIPEVERRRESRGS